jgi:hypothetical protein
MLSVVLEDEISQLNGMAILVDLRDLPSQNVTNINFNRKASKLFFELIRDALPISINAIHSCWPSEKSIAATLMPFASWLMGKDLRLRRVIYKGEPPVLSPPWRNIPSRKKVSRLPLVVPGTTLGIGWSFVYSWS